MPLIKKQKGSILLREDETWKKGMTVGLVSGVIWGFAALAVNYVTGIGPFERSLLIEITSFSIGGGYIWYALRDFVDTLL